MKCEIAVLVLFSLAPSAQSNLASDTQKSEEAALLLKDLLGALVFVIAWFLYLTRQLIFYCPGRFWRLRDVWQWLGWRSFLRGSFLQRSSGYGGGGTDGNSKRTLNKCLNSTLLWLFSLAAAFAWLLLPPSPPDENHRGPQEAKAILRAAFRKRLHINSKVKVGHNKMFSLWWHLWPRHQF